MAVKIRGSCSKVSESLITGVKETERNVEWSKIRVYEESSVCREIPRVGCWKGRCEREDSAIRWWEEHTSRYWGTSQWLSVPGPHRKPGHDLGRKTHYHSLSLHWKDTKQPIPFKTFSSHVAIFHNIWVCFWLSELVTYFSFIRLFIHVCL